MGVNKNVNKNFKNMHFCAQKWKLVKIFYISRIPKKSDIFAKWLKMKENKKRLQILAGAWCGENEIICKYKLVYNLQ